MERDQQMLEYVSEHPVILMRVYTWSSPTLSLGYFQPYKDRNAHPQSESIAVVRRATGGGAIVHHHDVTYSIAIPPSLLVEQIGAAQPVYDAIHDAMVDWLCERDFPAAKWSEPTCKSDKCSFLCFERRSLGDVIVGPAKVMGSAQRRLRGGLLQHGSLLLKTSTHAPSLQGLSELSRLTSGPESSDIADNETDSTGYQVSILKRLATAASDRLQANLQFVDAFPKEVGSYPRGNYSEEKWLRKR